MTKEQFERVEQVMTDVEITKKALKLGYKFYGHTHCKACRHEWETVCIAANFPDPAPRWVNSRTALMFKNDKEVIAACGCGWRAHLPFSKQAPKQVCKVRGCRAVLTKADTDGLCAKCRKEIEGGGNPATYSIGCTLKPKNGCMHYMQHGYSDCIKIKCPHVIPQTAATGVEPTFPATPIKKCSCGNALPEGRKKWCYTCRPKAKKEVASKVYI